MTDFSAGSLGNSAPECGSRSSLRAAMPWYCIQTHPGQAEQALRHINYQGFETFYPQLEAPRKIHNRPGPRPRVQYLPLFPNYLFVTFQVHQDHWQPLNSTHGVKMLIRFRSGIPIPLPLEAIALLEFQDQSPIMPPDNCPECHRFAVRCRVCKALRPQPTPRAPTLARRAEVELLTGRLVRITGSNAMTGWNALCTMDDGQRVALLVEIFGRSTRMLLGRDQVIPYSPE